MIGTRQSTSASASGSGLHPSSATVSKAFTSNSLLGSLWVCILTSDCIAPGPAFSTITPLLLTAGVAWNLLEAPSIQTAEASGFYFTRLVSIYYAYDVPVIVNSVPTVGSVSALGATNSLVFISMAILELTGCGAENLSLPPLYQVGSNNTYPGTSIAGTANLSISTSRFILSALGAGSGNPTHGSGYTSLAGIQGVQYIPNASPGSIVTSFGAAGNNPWVCLAAAFDPGVITPPTPTITNVSPNNGPSAGGTPCTITGTNFSGTIVTFGGNAATSVNVLSSTQITCVTPVGFPGVVDVKVVEPAGTVTLHNGYTYTSSKILVRYNFQDAGGHPLAYGTVTFTLNTDAITISGQQICAGRVTSFNLDVNGSFSGFIWSTDQMTANGISPNTTYRVKAYTASGQLAFEQDMVIST